MLRDHGVDFAIDRLDLGFQKRQESGEVDFDRLGTRCLEPVGAGLALGHHVASCQHQGLEPLALRIGSLPAGEVNLSLLAIVCQCPGIDSVGLAEDAEGPDEGP